jgi:hypothetical protein
MSMAGHHERRVRGVNASPGVVPLRVANSRSLNFAARWAAD